MQGNVDLHRPMEFRLSRRLFTLAFALLLTSTRVFGQYAVEEVAPGLFLHQGVHQEINQANGGDIGNSGFIIGSDAVAVIDPGGSAEVARALKAELRRHTQLPVKYLVLTHFHPDHVAGAVVFSEAEHVVAHKNYPRAQTQRSLFYLQRFPWLLPPGNARQFLQANLLVDQEIVVDLGERKLTLTAHPTAHTDNDLTILDETSQTLWASDIVFASRTPSLDGSLTGWIDVLDTLSSRSYKMVIPGHGEPGPWDEVVAPQQQYLTDLQVWTRQQLDDGVALSQIMRLNAMPNAASWFLFDQQHPVNLSKAYTELEWE